MSDNISMYDVYDPTKFFDPKELGCIMMRVEDCAITYSMNAMKNQYYSDDPAKYWAKGIEEEKHITVLYGFLPMVTKEDVMAALRKAWETYGGVETNFADNEYPMLCLKTQLQQFAIRNYGTADYDCWVLELDPDSSDSLRHVRNVLSTLPHVNTFAEYCPHMTLGYFKKGMVTPADFENVDYWYEGSEFYLGGSYKNA